MTGIFTILLMIVAVFGIVIIGTALKLLQDPVISTFVATVIVAWLFAKTYSIVFLHRP